MADSPNTTAKLRQFQPVRFNHERAGGPVHRVVSVMNDGMVELHDMPGYFASSLFSVADDIAYMPLGGVVPGACPHGRGGHREDCAAWPACACPELLPCPFCGGYAEYGEVGGEGDDAGGQFIQCTDARCGASSALIFPCGDEPKPLLRECWNRRNDRHPEAQNSEAQWEAAERIEKKVYRVG
jgi:hypothetical protein